MGSGALSALEKLGQKTANVISETANISLSAKAGGSGGGATAKVARKITLKSAFEDGPANAHLQALQMLSAENSLKLQSLDASAIAKELENIIDFDVILEGVEDELESSFIASESGHKEMVIFIIQ